MRDSIELVGLPSLAYERWPFLYVYHDPCVDLCGELRCFYVYGNVNARPLVSWWSNHLSLIYAHFGLEERTHWRTIRAQRRFSLGADRLLLDVRQNTVDRMSMCAEGMCERVSVKANSRVFALAISLASLGSSQIFLLPHRKMDDASRFCTLSELRRPKEIDRIDRRKHVWNLPHVFSDRWIC